MSFDDNLRLALDTSEQLPPQLDLGEDAYSWKNKKLESQGEQPDFRQLIGDELRQLMRRLQAAPQDRVTFLNLGGHHMGKSILREMAAPIAALKALQVLIFDSTHPPLTLCFCVCVVIWGCVMRCEASVVHTMQIMTLVPPDARHLQGP